MTDYSVFGALTGPTDVVADDAPYTMGLEFDVDEICWLKKIEFWQASGGSPSTSTRKALLFSVTDATTGVNINLGDNDFPATVNGWNSFVPTTPPQVSPGTVYRACVYHPDGRYSATSNYFSSGDGADPIITGPVRVMDADLATGGDQCSFVNNVTPQFPTASFNSTFYWINIVLTDVDPTIVATNESIADEARRLMLAALGYTVDQGKSKSNVDLMREVVAAGGLGLITVTSDTAAVHYWKYLKIVRDA
jgi:hypothetical protein